VREFAARRRAEEMGAVPLARAPMRLDDRAPAAAAAAGAAAAGAAGDGGAAASPPAAAGAP
jgi:hypothetical protein